MSAPPGSGELFDSGPPRIPWRRRWAALRPSARWLALAVVVVVLAGAGGLWYRDRAAERELAQRVTLTTSLQVTSSSTSPPGGSVGYFLVVRNDGPRPVSVTGVVGATDRLRLTMLDDGGPRLAPGAESAIPLSVRLTCGPARGPAAIPVEIRVRRQDGGSTARRIDLPAALVDDVATTLCAVRPGLRDHELSGPVLRPAAAGRPAGNRAADVPVGASITAA